jgi:hypothetical protein
LIKEAVYVGNDASIEIKRSVISVLTQQLFWIVQLKWYKFKRKLN